MRQNQRWVALAALLLVFSLVGLARLIDLQIIRGAYFRELSEGNRIRRIPIKAPRGEILDRNGRALARNIPVYKLGTFSEGGVVVKTEVISREEALRIQAEEPEKAARILVDVGREYPLGEAAAHVIGYVNEATREELAESSRCPNSKYQLGDLVGRTGIEAQYECVLRGVNGEELIEIDTRGRLVRKLGRREPIPGENIKLSIDAGLQEVAYKALQNAPDEKGLPRSADMEVVKGAVVAQEPDTGAVLALVSSPSFDPNKIHKEYGKLVSDPDKPLFNRVLGGAYPPGSTFKIVTAAAGLLTGKIDEEFEYEDTGLIRVGAFIFRNWYFTQYGRTEGLINVVRAITRSTDTFFYKVGEMVGVGDLASWAQKFGLGQKTGIDLPGEGVGLVPTPEWKQEARGERWFLGNTYHMAIGQGDITATPLQINQMTSVIASGGQLCTPQVATLEERQKSKCSDIGLEEEAVKLITEGMVGACSPGGTAFPLFNFTPRVACKTGTAEFGDPEDRTHAWLTAFAPVNSTFNVESESTLNVSKPEIAVTALVEGGGDGSRVAAPVVKEVLDYWFNWR